MHYLFILKSGEAANLIEDHLGDLVILYGVTGGSH